MEKHSGCSCFKSPFLSSCQMGLWLFPVVFELPVNLKLCAVGCNSSAEYRDFLLMSLLLLIRERILEFNFFAALKPECCKSITCFYYKYFFLSLVVFSEYLSVFSVRKLLQKHLSIQRTLSVEVNPHVALH